MADGTPLGELPAGAVPIVRAANGTSSLDGTTLYTVPAGKRLHVVSAWASLGGQSAAGLIGITAEIENDAARTLVVTNGAASGAAACAVSGFDAPVAAGDTVTIAQSGLTSGFVAAGFMGWEEPA